MRVMVFAKASEGVDMNAPPTPEMIEAFREMDRFTEELVKAGVFVAAAGLKNSAQAKRVVSDGPRRTVIDGPFAETKELIAGYWLWQVKSMAEAVEWLKRCPNPHNETRELIAGFSIWEVKDMDEALAWAKRCPNPMPGPSEVEIRPFYEAADLGGFVTKEELSAPREGERGKLGVA